MAQHSQRVRTTSLSRIHCHTQKRHTR